MRSCLLPDHLNELQAPISNTIKWKVNQVKHLTNDLYEQLRCKNDSRVALLQIAPVNKYAEKIIYYDNCYLCTYAAIRRQCLSNIKPTINMLKRFSDYFDNTILPELQICFSDFEYYYEIWFNHLTTAQQKDMLRMENLTVTELYNRYASIFCKSEKQSYEGGKPPKTRCISALNDTHKYVMGPIVFAMEQYLKKFKGYCGGKNWEDLAQVYDEWKSKGYKIKGLDVSGFDKSICVDIKKIIFHQTYKLLEPYIHHVDLDLYRFHAYDETRNLYTSIDDFGYITIEGSVLSGSMDTTALNTIAMISFIRFTIEDVLGAHPSDYQLLCKGDDTQLAIDNSYDDKSIIDAFRKVFCESGKIKFFDPQYIHYGLGITMKFFISGNTDDIDFCSTHVFYCKGCKRHRITRRLNRYMTYLPYSNSILTLTNLQREAYKQNLYESNYNWHGNLPIFRALNAHLQTNVKTNYSLIGKNKSHKKLGIAAKNWHDKYLSNNLDDELLKCKFGKTEYYSMLPRKQKILDCCVETYYQVLYNKYNLTTDTIRSIEDKIKNSIYEYDCEELIDAFQFNETYTEGHNQLLYL